MHVDTARPSGGAASRRGGATTASLVRQVWPPAPLRPQLDRAEVHVHRARLCCEEQGVRDARALLSATERAHADRFRFGPDADRFAAGRALLRRILSRYVEEAPERLRIAEASGGKPELQVARGGPPLRFSVSHSGDLLLVAVARAGPVGVDVERVRTFPELLPVAQAHLAPVQHEMLAALEGPARVELFFRFWTGLEAAQKATGAGLAAHGFGGSARVYGAGAERFSVLELRPAPGHVGALAHVGGHGPVRCWSWEGGDGV